MNSNDNYYYNMVFKNNKIRDCAKKAAEDLMITMSELKIMSFDKFK